MTITLAFITAQYCGDLRRQAQSLPFTSKQQRQECRSVGEQFSWLFMFDIRQRKRAHALPLKLREMRLVRQHRVPL